MNYVKLLIGTILLLFTACISDKNLSKSKNDDNKSEVSYAYLGRLTAKQKVVKSEVINYLNLLKEFDIDAIMEKTYPLLFTVINETHFKQYISAMFNSKDILVEKYDTNITKIGKVTTFSNGTEYAKISYTSKATILFLNDKLYNDETSINFLYDALIHKYGKENVEIDVKKRRLTIQKDEKLLILKERDGDWKFLGNNREYIRLYPTILPKEIYYSLNN